MKARKFVRRLWCHVYIAFMEAQRIQLPLIEEGFKTYSASKQDEFKVKQIQLESFHITEYQPGPKQAQEIKPSQQIASLAD